MNLLNLNSRQKEIINILKSKFDSEEQLETWLSLPNKMFRSKPPIDFLIAENYDYFDRLYKEDLK